MRGIYKNIDCMELMAGLRDKEIDLAIVDPPYGIGENGSKNYTRGLLAKPKNYKAFHGEDLSAPNKEYFTELFRVSKNQIIFGTNHFIENLPYQNSPCWIIWDKDNGETDFADFEMAWTSFNSAARKFKYRWNGMLQEDMRNKEIRIHPTQKPVALYKWLLQNYAKPGQIILDTHVGSGSSLCAFEDLGFDYIASELDPDYYKTSFERVQKHIAQGKLFEPEKVYYKEESLF